MARNLEITAHDIDKIEAVDFLDFAASEPRLTGARLKLRITSAWGSTLGLKPEPEQVDVIQLDFNDPLYAKRLFDVINGVVPLPAPAPGEEDEPTSGSD